MSRFHISYDIELPLDGYVYAACTYFFVIPRTEKKCVCVMFYNYVGSIEFQKAHLQYNAVSFLSSTPLLSRQSAVNF